MKTFLIDYRRPDGREDFKVVEAAPACLLYTSDAADD